MVTQNYKAWSVVTASTFAFTVCFMVWMMFAVIGIPIKKTLDLNETQFGILIALPVLTGSLFRLPVGMWTDRYGGRVVFFALMVSTIIPIWLISIGTEYWHYLVTGLFVGIAGASFTVGIAYCARWFPKERQGLAMGIFGAGNTGAALTKLIAPTIVVAYGWTMVPKVYAVLMLLTVVIFWMFTYTDPDHSSGKSTVTVREQLQALKDPTVWRYSQYYSIVFGGYVALSLWMTKYYITEYGFDLQLAALLAAAFSVPGGGAARCGRLVFRQIRRAYRDLVGVMGVAGVPVFPVVSADQCDHTDSVGADNLSCRAQFGRVHHTHVHDGHRLRHRQGIGIQIHLRRLSEKHWCGVRCGGSCRRHGRIHSAHHVRHAGRPDGRALVGFHAHVRHRLGVADVDVFQGGASDGSGACQAASRTRALYLSVS